MYRFALARTHLIALLVALSPEAATSQSQPRLEAVSLEVRGVEATFPTAPAGHVVLARVDHPEREPRVLPLRLAQSIDLPVGSSWELRFEVPGWWGPRALVAVQPGGVRGWVFNLWPAGEVRGRVFVKTGRLPKTVDLVAELPNGLRPESRCAVAQDGQFACPLPQGSREVVLVAGAFSPVHFPKSRIGAGQLNHLPSAELVPGAALVGQVLLEDGNGPGSEPPAVVRLYSAASPRSVQEKPRPLLERELPGDGYLSLGGLEAGPVVLEVSKPGYSPVRLPPLELSAGAEFRLPEPLRLTLPLDVLIEVQPAADPSGQPWKVRLERLEAWPAQPGKPVAGVTSAEGQFRAPAQAFGRFSLGIEDSAGNGFHRDRDLWITNRAEALVFVTLPLLEIRGDVTFDGQPLQARLFFGGKRSGGVALESDEAGRFSGTLPHPGNWLVDVEAAQIEARLTVLAEAGVAGKRATLKLEVPATGLFGRVLEENGEPAGGANVWIDFEGMALRVLELPVDGERLRKELYGLRVFHSGAEFGAHWLFDWRSALGLTTDSSLKDGVLRVPRVAAGQYTACFGLQAKVFSQPSGLEGTSTAGVTCRSGHLSGGDRLVLSLPPSAGGRG